MKTPSGSMKIAAVCCTFGRPELLGRMVHCFERQDYENRELVILDDAGQYGNQEGDRWKIVSVAERFPSLGEKRNAVLRLVSDDVDAIACWDDDDFYLPWQLSACVAVLEDALWCQPHQVLKEVRRRRFTRLETFNRREPSVFGYHGGWSFRRGLIEDVDGYAPISNGEDAGLATRLTFVWGPSANTITSEHPTPGYVFTQPGHHSGGYHLSAMGPGNEGYKQLGQTKIEPAGPLEIGWPEDYLAWPIGDAILPRAW